MAQKTWAVGEEVLAADFNTYLQQQVVPQFTGTAQRDSQWASPPNGAMCITIDTSTLWQRVGTTWYPCFKRVTGTTRTTNGPAAAAESIVLTTPAFAFPSGRLVRVMAGWRTCTGGSGEGMVVRIREGTAITGTELAQVAVNMAAAGAQTGTGGGGTISTPAYSPAVGTRQWILTSASTTANVVTMYGQAGGPIWIDVVDEGSA